MPAIRSAMSDFGGERRPSPTPTARPPAPKKRASKPKPKPKKVTRKQARGSVRGIAKGLGKRDKRRGRKSATTAPVEEFIDVGGGGESFDDGGFAADLAAEQAARDLMKSFIEAQAETGKNTITAGALRAVADLQTRQDQTAQQAQQTQDRIGADAMIAVDQSRQQINPLIMDLALQGGAPAGLQAQQQMAEQGQVDAANRQRDLSKAQQQNFALDAAQRQSSIASTSNLGLQNLDLAKNKMLLELATEAALAGGGGGGGGGGGYGGGGGGGSDIPAQGDAGALAKADAEPDYFRSQVQNLYSGGSKAGQRAVSNLLGKTRGDLSNLGARYNSLQKRVKATRSRGGKVGFSLKRVKNATRGKRARTISGQAAKAYQRQREASLQAQYRGY